MWILCPKYSTNHKKDALSCFFESMPYDLAYYYDIYFSIIVFFKLGIGKFGRNFHKNFRKNLTKIPPIFFEA